MSGDTKLIYFLVAIIIIFSIILLIEIKITPEYNPETYDEIYDEYESIFGKEKGISNMQDDKGIITENNNQTIGNVIAKIVIPKIDIEYPVIKETTTEYLKIAPTKYYGPEVNQIRKFCYSRS